MPSGKFHKQPLFLAPLVLEQINGCPLLTHLGCYFSDIVVRSQEPAMELAALNQNYFKSGFWF